VQGLQRHPGNQRRGRCGEEEVVNKANHQEEELVSVGPGNRKQLVVKVCVEASQLRRKGEVGKKRGRVSKAEEENITR